MLSQHKSFYTPGILNKHNNQFTIGDIFIYLILAAIFIITAYPFIYIIFLSVMPYEKFVTNTIHWLPNGFTLSYFKEILQDPELPRAYMMSVMRVLSGTTLDVVFTMLIAFAASRPSLRGKKILGILFLIPMFFGAGMIPYYLTIRAYGLMNSFWVLILPGMVSPMWYFVAKATLVTYPNEIIEAARIDGAHYMRIFWGIVWPTNLPIIATLAMMYGLGHWNEFFWTRILVNRDLWTAPVFLFSMLNTREMMRGLGLNIHLAPESFTAAVASSLILPVLIVYPFLQKYIIKGLILGAVKG